MKFISISNQIIITFNEMSHVIICNYKISSNAIKQQVLIALLIKQRHYINRPDAQITLAGRNHLIINIESH